jgi:hypothetical protein
MLGPGVFEGEKGQDLKRFLSIVDPLQQLITAGRDKKE